MQLLLQLMNYGINIIIHQYFYFYVTHLMLFMSKEMKPVKQYYSHVLRGWLSKKINVFKELTPRFRGQGKK